VISVPRESGQAAPALAAERVSVNASVLRAAAFRQERPVERPHLVSQDLFRDALVRERRRADRFEEPFVLVLISFDSRAARQSRWRRVIEMVSQTSLDADVIGWFEQGTVLGLIRSLADHNRGETTATMADSVRQELMRCLTTDIVGSCSIRLETYSPHGDSIPPVLADAGNRRRSRQDIARDAAKRALDIAGSAALLIVFSPVMLVVSALVKLTSKGPVFFRQQRLGKAGQPFSMLKFRTMQVNADPAIHQQYVEKFIQSSASSEPSKNVVFKIVDDPRVTPLGHFLRRSSLDEFPQFWNVLTGAMSLVGPRPPLPHEVARYKRWHRRRVLEAKPGITGLWQVTGRSRTTFDEMVRMDLRYAKSYSVWTDLKILLATPRAVLSGKGAH
jgi:lipopolysaccharide/colanic/teichoic acid biosynthesis glycosyltransferase